MDRRSEVTPLGRGDKETTPLRDRRAAEARTRRNGDARHRRSHAGGGRLSERRVPRELRTGEDAVGILPVLSGLEVGRAVGRRWGRFGRGHDSGRELAPQTQDHTSSQTKRDAEG